MSRTELSPLRREYLARINRALDYIEQNLDRPLTLRDIAEVANFSPYHFHRLFSALVGEPLNRFIGRVRLERAATQLLANPEKPVTDIALDCGFSGSSAFARAFREEYGVSASQWRRGGVHRRKGGQSDSKESITLGKDGQAHRPAVTDLSDVSVPVHPSRPEDNAMFEAETLQVRVEDLPRQTVAYVRHIGPYAGNEQLFQRLFGTLMKWAGPRDLMRPETRFITIYHDNPDLTDEDRLRISVCITVPEGTEVDGEIGKMVLPGGRYAVGHFEITANQYHEAWNALCGGWLPDSGYQPDDRPSFEYNLNDPNLHPEHMHIVDICIPVRPL